MKIYLTAISLCFTWSVLFAQAQQHVVSEDVSPEGQFQIIDSDTRLPIPYAQVKLSDQLKGIISDFDGFFVLDSTFHSSDTLIFSCIGYEKRSVSVRELLETKVIELLPSAKNISEVVVTAKKTKFQLRNLGVRKKPGKASFADYAGTAENGEEKAIWIPNDYSIRGELKSINVFVSDLGFPDAHFRIHVYECDPFETKPARELTSSNIIASGTQGNEWVTIDMSQEQITVGENGCFIGIEWFDSPKSIFHKDTIVNKGYTWDGEKKKDTVYSRIRKGNGAVIGAIYQKYSVSKNKHWRRTNTGWRNSNFIATKMFKMDTLPDGSTYLRTTDNHYQGVLCINVDVAFPKGKIKLPYEEPKKRKLNKLEKVKEDQFNYPQNNIDELFSSLIKAFEINNIIYVLKFLCVYEEGQLDDILTKIVDHENQDFISDEERGKIVENLKIIKSKLRTSTLRKVDNSRFELTVDKVTYHLIVEKGIWKINPYGHKIYK